MAENISDGGILENMDLYRWNAPDQDEEKKEKEGTECSIDNVYDEKGIKMDDVSLDIGKHSDLNVQVDTGGDIDEAKDEAKDTGTDVKKTEMHDDMFDITHSNSDKHSEVDMKVHIDGDMLEETSERHVNIGDNIEATVKVNKDGNNTNITANVEEDNNNKNMTEGSIEASIKVNNIENTNTNISMHMEWHKKSSNRENIEALFKVNQTGPPLSEKGDDKNNNIEATLKVNKETAHDKDNKDEVKTEHTPKVHTETKYDDSFSDSSLEGKFDPCLKDYVDINIKKEKKRKKKKSKSKSLDNYLDMCRHGYVDKNRVKKIKIIQYKIKRKNDEKQDLSASIEKIIEADLATRDSDGSGDTYCIQKVRKDIPKDELKDIINEDSDKPSNVYCITDDDDLTSDVHRNNILNSFKSTEIEVEGKLPTIDNTYTETVIEKKFQTKTIVVYDEPIDDSDLSHEQKDVSSEDACIEGQTELDGEVKLEDDLKGSYQKSTDFLNISLESFGARSVDISSADKHNEELQEGDDVKCDMSLSIKNAETNIEKDNYENAEESAIDEDSANALVEGLVDKFVHVYMESTKDLLSEGDSVEIYEKYTERHFEGYDEEVEGDIKVNVERSVEVHEGFQNEIQAEESDKTECHIDTAQEKTIQKSLEFLNISMENVLREEKIELDMKDESVEKDVEFEGRVYEGVYECSIEDLDSDTNGIISNRMTGELRVDVETSTERRAEDFLNISLDPKLSESMKTLEDRIEECTHESVEEVKIEVERHLSVEEEIIQPTIVEDVKASIDLICESNIERQDSNLTELEIDLSTDSFSLQLKNEILDKDSCEEDIEIINSINASGNSTEITNIEIGSIYDLKRRLSDFAEISAENIVMEGSVDTGDVTTEAETRSFSIDAQTDESLINKDLQLEDSINFTISNVTLSEEFLNLSVDNISISDTNDVLDTCLDDDVEGLVANDVEDDRDLHVSGQLEGKYEHHDATFTSPDSDHEKSCLKIVASTEFRESFEKSADQFINIDRDVVEEYVAEICVQEDLKSCPTEIGNEIQEQIEAREVSVELNEVAITDYVEKNVINVERHASAEHINKEELIIKRYSIEIEKSIEASVDSSVCSDEIESSIEHIAIDLEGDRDDRREGSGELKVDVINLEKHLESSVRSDEIESSIEHIAIDFEEDGEEECEGSGEIKVDVDNLEQHLERSETADENERIFEVDISTELIDSYTHSADQMVNLSIEQVNELREEHVTETCVDSNLVASMQRSWTIDIMRQDSNEVETYDEGDMVEEELTKMSGEFVEKNVINVERVADLTEDVKGPAHLNIKRYNINLERSLEESSESSIMESGEKDVAGSLKTSQFTHMHLDLQEKIEEHVGKISLENGLDVEEEHIEEIKAEHIDSFEVSSDNFIDIDIEEIDDVLSSINADIMAMGEGKDEDVLSSIEHLEYFEQSELYESEGKLDIHEHLTAPVETVDLRTLEPSEFEIVNHAAIDININVEDKTEQHIEPEYDLVKKNVVNVERCVTTSMYEDITTQLSIESSMDESIEECFVENLNASALVSSGINVELEEAEEDFRHVDGSGDVRYEDMKCDEPIDQYVDQNIIHVERFADMTEISKKEIEHIEVCRGSISMESVMEESTDLPVDPRMHKYTLESSYTHQEDHDFEISEGFMEVNVITDQNTEVSITTHTETYLVDRFVECDSIEGEADTEINIHTDIGHDVEVNVQSCLDDTQFKHDSQECVDASIEKSLDESVNKFLHSNIEKHIPKCIVVVAEGNKDDIVELRDLSCDTGLREDLKNTLYRSINDYLNISLENIVETVDREIDINAEKTVDAITSDETNDVVIETVHEKEEQEKQMNGYIIVLVKKGTRGEEASSHSETEEEDIKCLQKESSMEEYIKGMEICVGEKADEQLKEFGDDIDGNVECIVVNMEKKMRAVVSVKEDDVIEERIEEHLVQDVEAAPDDLSIDGLFMDESTDLNVKVLSSEYGSYTKRYTQGNVHYIVEEYVEEFLRNNEMYCMDKDEMKVHEVRDAFVVGYVVLNVEEEESPQAFHVSFTELKENEQERSYDSSSLDIYSEDDEPAYAINFRQEKIAPEIHEKMRHVTSEISIHNEPKKHAYWRTRKDVYIQHGMTYIVIHGIYE